MSCPSPAAASEAVERPAEFLRGFLQEAQELRRRPARLAAHVHPQTAVAQVRDGDLHAGEPRAEDRAGMAGDVDPVALEDELGVDAANARPAFGVVELAVVNARRDAEAARLRAVEGKPGEVALQPHLDLARLPGDDAAREPGARLLAHQRAERQVVREVLRVGAVERGRQVDAPGARAVVGVVAEKVAAQVGVGQRERRDVDAQALAVALPLDLAAEGVEHRARLGEHARQLHLGRARIQVHAAARLRGLERAGETGESRHHFARAQAEVGEARDRAIALRRRQRAAPFEAGVGQLPARLELERGAAQGERKRQRLGDACKRRELERVRGGNAAVGAPGELEVHRLQRRCALRRELQPAHLQLVAGIGAARMHARAGRSHLERRQVGRQRRGDVAQRDVGADLARHAGDDRGPRAQRAGAAMDLERIVDPRPPRRGVGVAELAVDLAVPAVEVRERVAVQLRAHLQRRAELAGQPREEPDPVIVASVGEPQVDGGEDERRRRALLVAPFHLRAAHHDLALVEEPVAEAAGAAGDGELHAAHVEGAGRVAPHGELRAFDVQRVQAQVAVGERAP